MYSNKKHNFENELLKAELAKADQLAKAVSATELDPFDKASVHLINQYKDGVEVATFREQMKRICGCCHINLLELPTTITGFLLEARGQRTTSSRSARR